MEYDDFLDTPIDQITEKDFLRFLPTQFLFDSWNYTHHDPLESSIKRGEELFRELLVQSGDQ